MLPRRVLIIDDRRDAVVPLSKVLKMDGHTVETAMDGPTGLAVVEGLAKSFPDFARYIVEFPFGDIYARKGLGLRERLEITAGGAGILRVVVLHEQFAHHAFNVACAHLRLQPHEVLHVGDDPLLDVAGAAGAGMRTCWINRWEERWPEQLPPPDLEFATLAGLADWLDSRHPLLENA